MLVQAHMGGMDEMNTFYDDCLEQLYPLDEELIDALSPYADGTPLVWVQEEPWNYGPWFYINAELGRHLGDTLPKSVSNLSVISRERSASPATGSKSAHNLEHERLVERAFG